MTTPKTILLADDEASFRLVVAHTLSDAAFRLIYAADGEEALELAAQERPDLILLDVAMPKLDGITVCRKLKANPATAAKIIILTARGSPADRRLAETAGADGFFVKPFSPIALLRRIRELLGDQLPSPESVASSATAVVEPEAGDPAATLVQERLAQLEATQQQLMVYARDLAASFRNEQRRAQELADALQQLRNAYLATVTALAHAIDAKDAYTAGHTARVGHYAQQIARLLAPQLLEDDAFLYGLVLHDIGKIGVPDAILSKPARLTPEEYAVMKRHPAIGAQIIEPIGFLVPARPAVLHHHERFDGHGYPHGLKGLGIPLVARVIAVADAWDAMTSNRAYRKALPLDQAVAELRRGSGVQFDPALVEVLEAVLNMTSR
ncbi:MAG: response regulator [Chloroflexi bacterium]|nr:response regulator [Chloroflexota bacterium]